MAEFQLGSISTGTLRTEDLLAAFHSTIESLQAQQAKDEGTPIVLADDGYMDSNEPYSDEELLTIYTEQLESFCPPFVYFGTLEGDGADFGFWVEQNAIDDFISEAIEADLITVTNTGDEYANGTYIVHLAHDTENVTVMDMERNAIWSAA